MSMRRILFLIAIVLISSCKTENKNEESQTTKPQEPVSEIPKDKDQFQMFLDQFPTKTLPVKIYGCSDEILGLPKLDIKLSAKYSKEAEYEHIYGIIPSKGNYISTITLGEAECFVPTLNTYKLNGEKIDSKPIFIGYCGSDPCYECVESMTINSDYRIYVADTIKTSDCDDNFKAIAGTEKIKVVYKEGKLTEKGIIELTEEVEKEEENLNLASFLENPINLQNFKEKKNRNVTTSVPNGTEFYFNPKTADSIFYVYNYYPTENFENPREIDQIVVFKHGKNKHKYEDETETLIELRIFNKDSDLKKANLIGLSKTELEFKFGNNYLTFDNGIAYSNKNKLLILKMDSSKVKSYRYIKLGTEKIDNDLIRQIIK